MALTLTSLHTDKQHLISLPDQQQANRYAIDVIDSGSYSLEQLRQQKDDLEEQVESLQLGSKLEQAYNSLRNHRASLSLLLDSQQSLSSSLKQLAAASQPPSLLQDLEVLQAKLTELQRIRNYVAVIHHAIQLSEVSLQSFEDNIAAEGTPKTLNATILEPFSQLQAFISSVHNTLTPIRSDGGVSLIPFLSELQRKTWDQLRDVLSKRLLSAAEKIKWPSSAPYDSLPPPDRVNFEIAFLDLLRFQELGISMRTCTNTDPLYPLVALIQPIAQRFHFHFETNRPTNRIDKPEWFLTHILNIVHEHAEFMNGVIKYLVGKTRFALVSPQDEFTRLLLPLPRRKLRLSAYECVSTKPPRLGLLANAVGQALMFDKKLLEDGFNVSGTTLGKARIAKSELNKWGVAWEVLGRSELFDVWVEGEKSFEEDEYHDIISSPDAWALSYSNETEGELMTTSCQRLASLFRSTISGTFLSLLPPSHQLIFLTKVILPLVDKYQERITNSLNAFETLGGILGRAIPGHMGDIKGLSSNAEMTTGIEGVNKLVKAWASARYIQLTLARWEDELVWIALWDYVIERRAEVSSDLGYLDLVPDDDNGESVFEIAKGKYERTGRRAEGMIVQQIVGEVRAELKDYIQGNWTKTKPSSWETEVVLENQTSLLLPALQKLTMHLNALPQILLIKLYKSVALQITQIFLTQSPLLTRHQRTSFEAGSQIKSDIAFWIRICRDGVGVVRGSARAWNLLQEVGDIIGMEDEKVNIAEEIAYDGAVSEDEWKSKMVGKLRITIEEADRGMLRDLLRCRDVTSY